MKAPPSLARVLLALCLPVAALSCGSGGPALHPVSGKVLLDGQPPAGATVVFQPVGGEAGAALPSGVVGEDGAFTLSTHPHGEGAAAGEYVVLVSWYGENARSLGNATPKNKLPARYADAARTPLPTVAVAAGPNDLPPFLLAAK